MLTALCAMAPWLLFLAGVTIAGFVYEAAVIRAEQDKD